jgi:hypothetical protein
MKFVCNDCQQGMEFMDKTSGDDGASMAVLYECPACGHSISMITNPGETQMVRSLGVTLGHEALQTPSEPMSMVREALAGQSSQATPAPQETEPVWTEAALKRLSAAPSFVQGMIRRLYTDYARQQGYAEITPTVMTEARDALGMTGM